MKRTRFEAPHPEVPGSDGQKEAEDSRPWELQIWT
jgi:hypothetical protein